MKLLTDWQFGSITATFPQAINLINERKLPKF